eukprot:6213345-Pleurochrysis_carterae.AAC.2
MDIPLDCMRALAASQYVRSAIGFCNSFTNFNINNHLKSENHCCPFFAVLIMFMISSWPGENGCAIPCFEINSARQPDATVLLATLLRFWTNARQLRQLKASG